MAFKLENLGSEIVNIKGIIAPAAPKYFIYFNEDNDTVTAASFIPDEIVAQLGIKTGDRVRVIPGTTTRADVQYCAQVSVSGVLTLTNFAE